MAASPAKKLRAADPFELLSKEKVPDHSVEEAGHVAKTDDAEDAVKAEEKVERANLSDGDKSETAGD